MPKESNVDASTSRRRRHSIDGSMHQSTHKPAPSNARRRLSFFGGNSMHVDWNAEETPADSNECKISLFPLFKRRLSIFGNSKAGATTNENTSNNKAKGRTVQLSPTRRRRLSIFGGNKPEEETSTETPSKVESKISNGLRRRHSMDGSLHTNIPASPIRPTKRSRRRHSIDGSMHQEQPSSPPRRSRRVDCSGSVTSSITLPSLNVIPQAKSPPKTNKGKVKAPRRRHSIDGSMHNINESVDKLTSFFRLEAKLDNAENETKNLGVDNNSSGAAKRRSKRGGRRRHSIDGSMHNAADLRSVDTF